MAAHIPWIVSCRSADSSKALAACCSRPTNHIHAIDSGRPKQHLCKLEDVFLPVDDLQPPSLNPGAHIACTHSIEDRPRRCLKTVHRIQAGVAAKLASGKSSELADAHAPQKCAPGTAFAAIPTLSSLAAQHLTAHPCQRNTTQSHNHHRCAAHLCAATPLRPPHPECLLRPSSTRGI